MIRIAALNDSSSDSEEAFEDTAVGGYKLTKEAVENAAYSLYTKGLSYERAGSADKAIQSFEDLLKSDFLTTKPVSAAIGNQLHPSALLKYSALKNLAKLYSSQSRNEEAIEALLQAFQIDSTDVSVSYRLGVLAKKLKKYVLACRAFEQGLKLSADHWPCLDNLITLLYALNNYEDCLRYIAKSFTRDCGYVKGLVIRKAILKEQPCLEKDYSSTFDQCDINEVNECTACLQEEDELEVLVEVRYIRDTLKEQCKPKPQSTVNLDLAEFSWAAVGKRLIVLYAYIEEKSPELDHFSPIVMNTVTDKENTQTSTHLPVPEVIVNVCAVKSDEEGGDIIPSLPLDSDNSQCAISASSQSGSENTMSVAAEQVVVGDCSEVNGGHSSSWSQSDSQVTAVMDDMITKVEEAVGNERQEKDDIVRDILNDILYAVVNSTVDSLLFDMVEQVAEVVDSESADELDVVAEVLEELVTRVDNETADIKVPSPLVGDHMYAKAYSLNPRAEHDKPKKSRPPGYVAEHKRRSTRVKLPTSKRGAVEKVTVVDKPNHVAEVKSLIPSILTDERTAEHAYHKGDNSAMDVSTDTMTDPFTPTPVRTQVVDFEDEAADVKEFLVSQQSNRGVVNTMRDWLFVLSKIRSFNWSPDLIAVYVDVYVLYRPCFQMPNLFSSEPVEVEALLAILWLELKLDLVKSADSIKSDLGHFFETEFTFWEMLIGSVQRLPTHCVEYSVRYYYMAARYYTGLGHTSDAIVVYKNLLHYMDTLNEIDAAVSSNNHLSKVIITKEKIESELMLLERAQSLDELNTVYGNGDYVKVLSLLKPTFDSSLGKRYTSSRLSQLSLLLDTVQRVADIEHPVKWLADSLQELVHHADNCRKGDWALLIVRNLVLIDSRLNRENVLDVSMQSMKRIVKSCLTIVHANVTALESDKQMPVKSVLPWILTSRLTDMQQSAGNADIMVSNEIAPSLEILMVAHRLLAKYSLCTCCQGALLKYTMQKALIRLPNVQGIEGQRIEQHINQCIYCLYGHPNRKVKAKNLSDHGSSTVQITWPAAEQLFAYYKPKCMPDFDSYKSITISAELEHLFRKLVSLAPPEYLPDTAVSETIDSFLCDHATLADLDKLTAFTDSPLCAEVFYLLADYYFKNKEPLKAIKHYVQDLYYKPGRFDSWAGMALAKNSRLESKLILMERQSYDGAFQKLAVSTVQSFTRALQLNRDNVKLWIEYAGSSYQLHSFASRVMKTKKSDLSSTELSTFTEVRKDMLEKSKRCYIEASLCKSDEFEEEWLHHYMLGKIAEKSAEEPSIYLNHYVKAGKCLNEDGAQYPSKISYMYNPSYLAVEALEMYYRVHASILKYVQRSQSTQHYPLFSKIVNEMKKCPFVTALMPSPQTPVGRKRKGAPETGDKAAMVKARKTDSELVITALSPKVATRRRQKLRQDAEIVSEVVEDLLLRVEALAFGSNSSNSPPKDVDSSILMEVTDVIRDVVNEVESNHAKISHSAVSSQHSSPQAILSLSCLDSPDHSNADTSNVASASPSTGVEHSPTSALPVVEVNCDTTEQSISYNGKPSYFQTDEQASRKHKLEQIPVIDHCSSISDDESSSSVEVVSQLCLNNILDQLEQTDAQTGHIVLSCDSPSPLPMSKGEPASVVIVEEETPAKHDKLSTDNSVISKQGSNADIGMNPTIVSTAIPMGPSSPISIVAADNIATSTTGGDNSMELTVTSSSHSATEGSPVFIPPVNSQSSPSSVIVTEACSSAPDPSWIVSDAITAAAGSAPVDSTTTIITSELGYGKFGSPTSATVTTTLVSADSANSNAATPYVSTSTTAAADTVTPAIVSSTSSPVTHTPTASADSHTSTSSADAHTSTSSADAHTSTSSADAHTSTSSADTHTSTSSADAHTSTSSADTHTSTTFSADTHTYTTSSANAHTSATSSAVAHTSAISSADINISTTCPVAPTSATSVDTHAPTTSSADVNKSTNSSASTHTSVTFSATSRTSATLTTSSVNTHPLSTLSADTELSATAMGADADIVTPAEILSRDELIEACIIALKLCLQRYPLHYKSYFRLAKTYLHSGTRKDLDKVQDLLLGNTAKKREDRFVPQGLFQDRKHNNFFNGVWRNPVEEIERAGSFGAHLHKTIYLLLQFLHEKRDYHLLYQLHTQLQRTPEQERKFLKDADRLLLSSKAMEFAIHSLYKTIGVENKAEYNYAASLHQAYKWFNYCNKNIICIPNAQVLLIKSYKSYKATVDEKFDVNGKIAISEAKDFCYQMFSSRSKDKTKPSTSETKPSTSETILTSGETMRLQVTPITSATSLSTAKSSKDSDGATLPRVRGSFQTYDCDKAKKSKPDTQSSEGVPTVTSEKLTNPSSDIPSSSWLNKAKDGTKALASMFTKPK